MSLEKLKFSNLGLLAVSLIVGAGMSAHAQQVNLMTAYNRQQLTRAVCMDAGTTSKIIIASMDLLKSTPYVECPSGNAAIRFSEDPKDPGHALVNIDPPKGSGKGLDCDAKADIGLSFVALNCLEASMEAKQHKKNY